MLNCQGSLGAFFKGKTFFDLGVYARKPDLVWDLVCGEPQLAWGGHSRGPCPRAQSQAGSFHPAHSRTPSPWNFSILFLKLGQLLCCPFRISTSIYFWWWVEKTLFHKCSPYLEAHGECPQFISMETWVHLIKMKIKMWFSQRLYKDVVPGHQINTLCSSDFWKSSGFRTGTEILKPWDNLKRERSQILPWVPAGIGTWLFMKIAGYNFWGKWVCLVLL